MSKQEVLEVINTLPDDVSFDEVMYSLYMEMCIRDRHCSTWHIQNR